MEKTIKIDGKKVTLKATAGALVRYKQQFGTDYIDDLCKFKTLDESDKSKIVEMYVKIGYQLIWSMAKTADSKIPSPDLWIKKLKKIDIDNLLSEATALFDMSMAGIEDCEDGGEPISAESLLAVSLSCGLNTTDIDNLSMSMLLNTIKEYCELRDSGDNEQAYFDSFRR